MKQKKSLGLSRSSLIELTQSVFQAEIDEIDGQGGLGAKQIASLPLRGMSIHERAKEYLSSQFQETRYDYPKHPKDFFREVFGVETAPFQDDMLELVLQNPLTAITACTSIGKSYLMARFVLYWLHTRPDSIVLTTGPSGRQVERVMWGNVRDAAGKAKVPLLGDAFVARYQISPMWYGYGFKASKENLSGIQGFHANDFLVIIDEATGVPDDMIDVLYATMQGNKSRMVLLSNPVSTSGRLYEAFHSGAGMWATKQISFRDTPNYHDIPEYVTLFEEWERQGAIGPPPDFWKYAPADYEPTWEGMINWTWVYRNILVHGYDSPYIRSRVWGEFVSDEDVLIPLSFIDRSMNFEIEDIPPSLPKEAGLDVSRFGSDMSVLTIREGDRVTHVKEWRHGMRVTELAKAAMEEIERVCPELSRLKVDEIGVGGGVQDVIWEEMRNRRKLNQKHYRVIGINVSRKSSDKEQWRNQRQEGFNRLALRFRRGQIALPSDYPVAAVAELSDIRYSFDEHTQPVVEKKDEFRRRRDKSPDYADSLMLAFFNPRPTLEEKTGIISQGSVNLFGKRKNTWR